MLNPDNGSPDVERDMCVASVALLVRVAQAAILPLMQTAAGVTIVWVLQWDVGHAYERQYQCFEPIGDLHFCSLKKEKRAVKDEYVTVEIVSDVY